MSECCVICTYGKTRDCAYKGVIYQNECQAGNAICVGETGWILPVRIKEHLASMRRGTSSTALRRHELEQHNGAEFEIGCRVLAHETEICARKA